MDGGGPNEADLLGMIGCGDLPSLSGFEPRPDPPLAPSPASTGKDYRLNFGADKARLGSQAGDLHLHRWHLPDMLRKHQLPSRPVIFSLMRAPQRDAGDFVEEVCRRISAGKAGSPGFRRNRERRARQVRSPRPAVARPSATHCAARLLDPASSDGMRQGVEFGLHRRWHEDAPIPLSEQVEPANDGEVLKPARYHLQRASAKVLSASFTARSCAGYALCSSPTKANGQGSPAVHHSRNSAILFLLVAAGQLDLHQRRSRSPGPERGAAPAPVQSTSSVMDMRVQ